MSDSLEYLNWPVPSQHEKPQHVIVTMALAERELRLHHTGFILINFHKPTSTKMQTTHLSKQRM